MQWSFLYFYRLTVGGQGCQRKGDLCGNIDTEGLITIPQFTYKDEGFYVCTGTRDNDTSYELRHVLIRGKKPFMIMLITLT